MRIPTIILRADSPALLQFNGSALGEADKTRFISLPVAPDGVYYITAQPLKYGVERLFPVTRKIELRRGKLVTEALSDDVFITLWPGDVFDVLLCVGRLETPRYELASTLAREKLRDGRIATLFREGGLHIVIEKREEQLFAHSLSHDGTASMQRIMSGTDELLFILVKHANGVKCCCISCNPPRVVYEGEGDSFAFAEGGIVRIAQLDTLLKHQRREAYSASTGEILHSSIGWFTYTANMPQSELDAAKCLLDAVKYALDELPTLLGGALESLRQAELEEFFGSFESYAEPPAELSDKLLLGLLSPGEKPQVKTARLFAFEVDSSDGYKVVNAQEL